LISVDQFTNYLKEESHVETLKLAVVDLELKIGIDRRDLGDYDGRDVVLPKHREAAPWLPVVLQSGLIIGDPQILGDITASGFDIVVTKGFFSDSRTNRKEWEDLKRRASLARIASLTGRPVSELNRVLADNLVLEYGTNIGGKIEQFGLERTKIVLKLPVDCGGDTRRLSVL